MSFFKYNIILNTQLCRSVCSHMPYTYRYRINVLHASVCMGAYVRIYMVTGVHVTILYILEALQYAEL